MKKMHKTKDAYTNESKSYLVQHRAYSLVLQRQE